MMILPCKFPARSQHQAIFLINSLARCKSFTNQRLEEKKVNIFSPAGAQFQIQKVSSGIFLSPGLKPKCWWGYSSGRDVFFEFSKWAISFSLWPYIYLFFGALLNYCCFVWKNRCAICCFENSDFFAVPKSLGYAYWPLIGFCEFFSGNLKILFWAKLEEDEGFCGNTNFPGWTFNKDIMCSKIFFKRVIIFREIIFSNVADP